MYRCLICASAFEQPVLRTLRENLDGENGWWVHTQALCPCCGEAEIEAIRS